MFLFVVFQVFLTRGPRRITMSAMKVCGDACTLVSLWLHHENMDQNFVVFVQSHNEHTTCL